jgi:hypothetical protein
MTSSGVESISITSPGALAGSRLNDLAKAPCAMVFD